MSNGGSVSGNTGDETHIHTYIYMCEYVYTYTCTDVYTGVAEQEAGGENDGEVVVECLAHG